MIQRQTHAQKTHAPKTTPKRHTPMSGLPMSWFRRAQCGGKPATAASYVRDPGDGPTDKTSQYLRVFQTNAYP
jgi:hypothetical protein